MKPKPNKKRVDNLKTISIQDTQKVVQTFLSWLENRGIELCSWDAGEYVAPTETATETTRLFLLSIEEGEKMTALQPWCLLHRLPAGRDPAYMSYIRQKRCCLCGSEMPSFPHHYRQALSGISRKPDDRLCIPLCGTCHDKVHHGLAINRDHALQAIITMLTEWVERGGE